MVARPFGRPPGLPDCPGLKRVDRVADQLGHADPALTLRVYAHILPQEETDLSFADSDRPGRTRAPCPRAAVGRSRKYAKRVVTRARFERATPSFGGWDRNLVRRCIYKRNLVPWFHNLRQSAPCYDTLADRSVTSTALI